MANASRLLSIPPELHRTIALALHDPLQLPTTSRLVNGLFDVARPTLQEDPGRRGLLALSQTCKAMRDVAQPILFSRVEVDSIAKLRGLTGRDEDGDEEAETDEEEGRRNKLCGAVRWLHIDFSLFLGLDLLDYWYHTLPLLQALVTAAADVRVLSLEAGRFDALILSHLVLHIHTHSLLPMLSSFGLREESVRNPPGAPAHDAMVALLPFFDGRTGLRWIQIDTTQGILSNRLELMVDKWRANGTRLRGLRVTVEGEANDSRAVLGLLRGNGDPGDEHLLEDIRELVIRIPSWPQYASAPTALTYINPHTPILSPLTHLHTLSLGFGFGPANSTVFEDATVSLANSIPSLELVFWPGFRRPNRVYAVSISRRPKMDNDGEWEDVTEDDLVLMGMVGGEAGFRTDEWAESVGGEWDWPKLLA